MLGIQKYSVQMAITIKLTHHCCFKVALSAILM